jgi:hypothetical protein
MIMVSLCQRTIAASRVDPRTRGRLVYRPKAPASVWQRPARAEFGAAAGAIEQALAASRRYVVPT